MLIVEFTCCGRRFRQKISCGSGITSFNTIDFLLYCCVFALCFIFSYLVESKLCQRSVIGYGIIQDINYNSLHLLYSQRKTPFSIRLSLFIASFDSLAIIWFALSISSAISVFIWFVQFSFQHPCHTVNVHTYFDLTLLQVLPFHTLAVPFWIPQGFHRFPVRSYVF